MYETMKMLGSLVSARSVNNRGNRIWFVSNSGCKTNRVSVPHNVAVKLGIFKKGSNTDGHTRLCRVMYVGRLLTYLVKHRVYSTKSRSSFVFGSKVYLLPHLKF